MNSSSITLLGRRDSVKNKVILILANKGPLNPKKTYNEIQKQGVDVTYQAVHKALKGLLLECVVNKNQDGYELSKDWLKSIASFAERFNSSNELHFTTLFDFKSEGNTKCFSFSSLEELEIHRKKLQWEFIDNKLKKHPYCSFSNHLKSPIVFSEKSLSILDNIKKTKTICYLAVKKKTEIDNWCASYYKNEFVNILTGSESTEDFDCMILDDIIVQTFTPYNLSREMDEYYSNIRNIEKILIPSFYSDLYKKPGNFKMIIQKNFSLANILRNNIISKFKKGIAVFDVDGTIVEGFLIYNFATSLRKNNLFDKLCYDEMMRSISLFKEGKIEYFSFASRILDLYARGIAHQRVDNINKAADIWSDNIIVYNYIKKVVPLLSNTRIVLLTASPLEIVNTLRKFIPIDDIVSSLLETIDGIYSGKIILNLTEKGRKLEELEKLQISNVLQSNSIGFGNTEHDIEFLEKVKTPVAVFPTKNLRKIATENKWDIIDDDLAFKDGFLAI